jgi:chromosome segregation ATPase
MEAWRAKSALAECQASLQAERSERQALEQIMSEQTTTIKELRHQLSIERDTVRDLSCSTARLSEAVWDLAGADDVEAETQRVRVRYDEQELQCVRLKRRIACMISEKAQLNQENGQWAERCAHLCTQSNREIVQRDETIHALQGFIREHMRDPSA